MRFHPHAYQRHAIDRVLEQPAVGLFLDMGLGKTVITLTALVELMHDRFEVARPLIIAPLRVAETTWATEAAKWDHTRHLRVARVLGPAAARRAALREDADVWVVNRENVPWLVEELGADWPFDMVVIDELSSFKSSSARRFRALRKVRPMIKRVVGLTGTPAPNGLIDLWPQVYLLDGGARLGRTATAYRERWFTPAAYVYAGGARVVSRWAPRPGAEREIYAALSDLVVSMRAADWLDLPERVDRVVEVELPRDAREAYARLERDYVLEVEDGSAVVAGGAAVLAGKLLQLAGGAVYDESGAVRELHTAKLDALDELVEASAGKPVLVFYAFKHERDRIVSRIKGARELRGADDVEAWNRGEISVLLAHPASAGHGINLQAGGSTIVWYGLPWSLELYQQACARLHRQGQTERVIVHHLVARDTVDADVMRALAAKGATQDGLLDALRARVERVRRDLAR